MSHFSIVFEMARLLSSTTGSGIYFLCSEGVVVYIGKALNITRRLRLHVKENTKIFDAVYFVSYDEIQLERKERRYIKQFKPRYNILLKSDRPLGQSAPCKRQKVVSPEVALSNFWRQSITSLSESGLNTDQIRRAYRSAIGKLAPETERIINSHLKELKNS